MKFKVSLTKADCAVLDSQTNGAEAFNGTRWTHPTINCTGYEFKLRRDALRFAIWAGAWITRFCKDGVIHDAYPEFSY